MKKTPADFAATPSQNMVHAVIASAAIVGIANSMTIPAKATTGEQATYDTLAQKSFTTDVRNGYTYGTAQTSSRQGYGNYTYIGNDDNNNYSDNY